MAFGHRVIDVVDIETQGFGEVVEAMQFQLAERGRQCSILLAGATNGGVK
jgi:hypothetical protein